MGGVLPLPEGKESVEFYRVFSALLLLFNSGNDQASHTTSARNLCSGSEAGSYLRLIDFVYHSTLGLRVISSTGCFRRCSCSSTPGTTRQTIQHHPETRKVDVRLPRKGNSNSHGARPVHLIITMVKWIRTSRLSIKKSLSLMRGRTRTRETRPVISKP